MAENPVLGRLLTRALSQWEDRHYPEKLSHKEIGVRVGKALQRKPFSWQAVGRWFAGREPESMTLLAALLGVLEADRAEFGKALFSDLADSPVGESSHTADDSASQPAAQTSGPDATNEKAEHKYATPRFPMKRVAEAGEKRRRRKR